MYTCQCVSDFRFMISMIFYWILFVFLVQCTQLLESESHLNRGRDDRWGEDGNGRTL